MASFDPAYLPKNPSAFVLDGDKAQTFFDDLLAKLQSGAFEEAVVLYHLPLSLKLGRQSSVARSYGDLYQYLKRIRSHHDPELRESINVFSVKPTKDGKWLVDLEWIFTTASGLVANFANLQYTLLYKPGFGLRISHITVMETNQLAALKEVPLIRI